MKKTLTFLLAMLMALSLTACGGGNDIPGTSASRSEQQPSSPPR